MNVDYIQIHPTTLYSRKPGRRFLISESVRGEGAVLLNKEGQRFADELLPRDVLTAEIRKQMELDGTDYVMLSLASMEPEEIIKRFPNIYKYCLEQEGYDISREPIPVVPAQHYFMGGVRVDCDGHTSMKRLYAAGETACNGVHGANRLASNSLLESLVWAERAALSIAKDYQPIPMEWCEKELERGVYAHSLPESYDSCKEAYYTSVRHKIEEDQRKRQRTDTEDNRE
jgi:L-aspartate oxidase